MTMSIKTMHCLPVGKGISNFCLRVRVKAIKCYNLRSVWCRCHSGGVAIQLSVANWSQPFLLKVSCFLFLHRSALFIVSLQIVR